MEQLVNGQHDYVRDRLDSVGTRSGHDGSDVNDADRGGTLQSEHAESYPLLNGSRVTAAQGHGQ